MSDQPFPTRFYNTDTPVEPLNSYQIQALNSFRAKLAQNLYTFEEVPCVCGKNEYVTVATRDRYALEVTNRLCKACGMMWQSPRMTSSSLNEFYNTDYRPVYVGEALASDQFFNDQVDHGHVIYEFVKDAIQSSGTHAVFDVGCGAGGTLLPFAKAGWKTFGCDLGGDYLNRGRMEGLILEQGDVNSLKQYGIPDLIILSHVLEHLSNPLNDLLEMASILPIDGYIYIELPGIFSIHKSYGDVMLFLQNAHLYHFTLTTLTRLMARAGFTLVKGDEYIHALFKKSEKPIEREFKNIYRDVFVYLYRAEIDRTLHLTSATRGMRRAAVKAIKRIIGEDNAASLKKKLRYFL